MKSNKRRRTEIQAARRKRAEREYSNFDPTKHPISENAIIADQSKLVTFGTKSLVQFPLYYLDKPYICRSCGSNELWTAKQQKWWYEIAQGAIETTAVRCRSCRNHIRAEKIGQQEHMEEVANRTPHRNEAFFKKKQ